jgi:hypothetical protein
MKKQPYIIKKNNVTVFIGKAAGDLIGAVRKVRGKRVQRLSSLKKQLAYESRLVGRESLKVLAEFERLDRG